VLFDLDDTLLDWASMDEAMERTCAIVASAHGDVDALALSAANRLVWERYWPEVERDWMIGSLADHDVGLEAWRRTLAACGIADDGLADLASATLAREEETSYRLHVDAAAVLDATAARVPVALVTNGAATTQRRKLAALGIERTFHIVGISAEVGAAKPIRGSSPTCSAGSVSIQRRPGTSAIRSAMTSAGRRQQASPASG
jgi:putative hydrolase of the HAD superfamily